MPGDGIGPEIVAEAEKVLAVLGSEYGLDAEIGHAPVGGAAYDAHGHPLPAATLELVRAADAILLGAVGGPHWEKLERSLRPEQGLLGLRAELGLFANLRPAMLYPQLAEASTLKPEIVSGLDIMIVRELTGGIYFGKPRGIRTRDDGQREGFNTLVYSESEIERIARVGVRDRAQALAAAVLGRQGQCAGMQRAVARGGGADWAGVHGCRAESHVR